MGALGDDPLCEPDSTFSLPFFFPFILKDIDKNYNTNRFKMVDFFKVRNSRT